VSAQPAPSSSSLRVEVISCVLEESAVDVSEMLAIARAELAPRALGARETDADGAPLLRVDACHDGYLLLRSLKPLGAERRIALHDVSVEQRPRVAALALAELVVVALTQSSAAPTPPPPPVAAQPGRPAPARPLPLPDWSTASAVPERRPPTLGVGLEVRLFTDSVSFSYGPRLEFSLPYFELALLALFSRTREELGEYRTGVVALSPSYPFFRSRTRAQVALSIGADVGVSWGSARPYEPSYGGATLGSSLFASGFAQLGLSGPFSERTFGRMALLGGYSMGVHARELSDEGEAASRPRASTQGPMVSLALGLAWAM
ncbi:MAG TPA: hypothetical protein VFZ61_27830, partial [Polyangiales bacterium]